MLGTNSEANDNLRWPKKTKSKTNCTDAIIEESSKSDSVFQEKLKLENPYKHFNMYKKPLKGSNNKYSNSLLTNLKSINNVSQWSNRKQPTEPFISNGTRNVLLENIVNNTTESWKENNSVEKIRLTMLSFMNSLISKMIPLINLHAIANPFMQVSTELLKGSSSANRRFTFLKSVCRLANNVNLDIAEILCRKRTEAAVIIWMANKLNQ